MGSPDLTADLLDRIFAAANAAVRDRLSIDRRRRSRVMVPTIRALQAEVARLYVRLCLILPPADRHGREAFFALLDAATGEDETMIRQDFDRFRAEFSHAPDAPDLDALPGEFAATVTGECVRQGVEAARVAMVERLCREWVADILDASGVRDSQDAAVRQAAVLKAAKGWKDSHGIRDPDLTAAILADLPALRRLLTGLARCFQGDRDRAGVPASETGGPRMSVERAQQSEFIRAAVAEACSNEQIAAMLAALGFDTLCGDRVCPEAVAEYRDGVLRRSARRKGVNPAPDNPL